VRSLSKRVRAAKRLLVEHRGGARRRLLNLLRGEAVGTLARQGSERASEPAFGDASRLGSALLGVLLDRRPTVRKPPDEGQDVRQFVCDQNQPRGHVGNDGGSTAADSGRSSASQSKRSGSLIGDTV